LFQPVCLPSTVRVIQITGRLPIAARSLAGSFDTSTLLMVICASGHQYLRAYAGIVTLPISTLIVPPPPLLSPLPIPAPLPDLAVIVPLFIKMLPLCVVMVTCGKIIPVYDVKQTAAQLGIPYYPLAEWRQKRRLTGTTPS